MTAAIQSLSTLDIVLLIALFASKMQYNQINYVPSDSLDFLLGYVADMCVIIKVDYLEATFQLRALDRGIQDCLTQDLCARV
jgi:hypothetical protein